MAGNTISIPVVGAIAAVLLGSTRLVHPMGLPRPLPPADVAAGSCTSPTWIGPQRAGEKCSEWDILVPKTGHKNVAAPARNSQMPLKKKCVQKRLEQCHFKRK